MTYTQPWTNLLKSPPDSNQTACYEIGTVQNLTAPIGIQGQPGFTVTRATPLIGAFPNVPSR